MKKFIAFMILLLIISGTVFYFGWVRIPENSVGLIYSDITGYDSSLMKPGQINWKWQKLIPKNHTVRIFSTGTTDSRISVSGEYPSGNIYSTVLEGNPDFSYSGEFRVTYKIKEDCLYKLAVSGLIGDNGTEDILKDAEEKIEGICSAALAEETGSALRDKRPVASGEELTGKIMEKLASLDEAEIIGIEAVSLYFPDTELYTEGKKQYMEMLETKKELVLTQEKDSAAYTSEIEKRIETLKKYGALLTEYPILIEYLKTKDEKLLPEGVDLNF